MGDDTIILEVRCLRCRRLPCVCAGGVEVGDVVTGPPAADACMCGHARGEHGDDGACTEYHVNICTDYPCGCKKYKPNNEYY